MFLMLADDFLKREHVADHIAGFVENVAVGGDDVVDKRADGKVVGDPRDGVARVIDDGAGFIDESGDVTVRE